MNDFDYVNRTYGVNACIGRRVIVYGKNGTIIKALGHYIGVNFDESKPGKASPCHPEDQVTYLDEIVKPRKATRSQLRYARYLAYDCGYSFAEWLGIKRKEKA